MLDSWFEEDCNEDEIENADDDGLSGCIDGIFRLLLTVVGIEEPDGEDL